MANFREIRNSLVPVDRSKAIDPSNAPRRPGKERIDHGNRRVASVLAKISRNCSLRFALLRH
jgi:hypothetical protein